jgi:drug/metabolite transporter (DMT)-like permease
MAGVRGIERAQLRGHLLVNFACLLWGGNMLSGRVLRHLLTPGLVVTLRGAISVLALALLVRALRAGLAPGWRRDLPLLAFMAASGVAAYQGAIYLGLRYTDAVNASLMNGVAPLATLLLARILHGTPLRGAQLAGTWLSIAGIAVLLSGGSVERLLALRLNPGDLVILGAVALWAGYSLAGQSVFARHGVLPVTLAITVLALPMTAPWGAWEWTRATPVFTPLTVAVLLYISLGVGVVALLAWNTGVKALGPGEAMAFMNMTPLYAAAGSVLVLGEPLGMHQIIGAALVVGGCLIAALWGVPLRAPAPQEERS